MTKPTIHVGGVPEHFNLPWHLALESGALDNQQFNVNFHEYPGGSGQMTAGLAVQRLDVAILLTEGAVKDILCGGTNKIVKVYTDSPLIWGIHVAANSQLSSIADLRGSRYAISRFGSGSHLMAIVDAAERGWDTSDMRFVKIGNLAGARSSLAAGESDVFFWEKFMTKPLVDSGEFRCIGERKIPWPSFVVSARTDFLNEHEAAVRTMLEIINGVCHQLMHDPAAAQVIASRYQLQLEDAQQWFRQTHWSTEFDIPSNDLLRVMGYLRQLELVADQSSTPDDICHHLRSLGTVG